MTKSSMKKSREYLCFTKRDDNGNAIRDSYGKLVPDYREEDVYRVRITDNEGIYEWCIHHKFDKSASKRWIISDCGTGAKMSTVYRTRKEAYEHINERLLKTFKNVRKTDYYKALYYSHIKFVYNKYIYDELKKEIEYALNSKSLTLAYQAYGAAKMARKLSAITKEQFYELNEIVVVNGINKPSAGLK